MGIRTPTIELIWSIRCNQSIGQSFDLKINNNLFNRNVFMAAIISSIFKCSVFNYWMDSSDRDCDKINLPLQLEKTFFNYNGESSKTFLQKIEPECFSTNWMKNWSISLEKDIRITYWKRNCCTYKRFNRKSK